MSLSGSVLGMYIVRLDVVDEYAKPKKSTSECMFFFFSLSSRIFDVLYFFVKTCNNQQHQGSKVDLRSLCFSGVYSSYGCVVVVVWYWYSTKKQENCEATDTQTYSCFCFPLKKFLRVLKNHFLSRRCSSNTIFCK